MSIHTYTKVARSQRCQGGDRTVWTLGFPAHCQITALRVLQVGGAPVAFTITLYSSAAVIAASLSQGDDSDDPHADPLMYKVGPDQMPSDGAGQLDKTFDPYLTYTNMDAVGPTNKKQRIYVEIATGGGGDQSFDVALDTLTEY